ncbi:hypothetical protein [Streptomyces humi]
MTTPSSWAVTRLLRDRDAALCLTSVVVSLVELVGHRLLLVVLGGALLRTACAPAQRSADRTAARSSSDANPA